MRELELARTVGDAVRHAGDARDVLVIVGAGARDERRRPAEHAVNRRLQRGDEGRIVRGPDRVWRLSEARYLPGPC